MTNRTVQALKAIDAAWKKEQELVREGKGTRDWTPEQQQDILSSGKAHDEKGKAFEGQHMKSVEKYPECQGDPDNIQFLTRQEHLTAHGGSWQNPTNWYYDPVTAERLDFGDGPCIPCEIIDLSELYVPEMPEDAEIIEDGSDIPEKAEIAEETAVAPPDVSDCSAAKVPKAAPTVRPKQHSFGQAMRQAGKSAAMWFAEHPGVVTALKIGAATVMGTYVISKVISGVSESGSSEGSGYPSASADYGCDSGFDDDCIDLEEDTDDDTAEEKSEHGYHATPKQHPVASYTQIRRGKEVAVRAHVSPKNPDKSDDE
ncbi:MAG: teneurin-3 [Bacillota bacterium]|nr:teneurin-3 [Bacillota bacterium]